MGIPIVVVTSGGVAVTEATTGFGTPVTIADNGFGLAVTLVASGGMPVVGASVSPGGALSALLLEGDMSDDGADGLSLEGDMATGVLLLEGDMA